MKTKIAALFHQGGWRLDSDKITLKDGVELIKLSGSKIEQLYHKLCSEGLDNGDPFEYDICAIIPGSSYFGFASDNPYSVVARISSVLSVCLNQPLGMCRTIQSNDDFKSCTDTDWAYKYTAQTDEFLSQDKTIYDSDYPCISENNKDVIVACYDNLSKMDIKTNIFRATQYFFLAQRNHYLERA